LADLLWLAFVVWGAAALSRPAPAAQPAMPAAQIGD
jgi:hypothetical protein